MTPSPDATEEPANLRFLRRLVTTLAAVMIVGLVIVIVLLVIRLSTPAAVPALPDTITLPEGASAQAVTIGADWYGVVTDDGRFLIFDRTSGALRQSVTLD
ncbi:DUF6476 family protein [Pontibaca methylaminivorans]|nr:DUF6476 family protein [Pontibaca methylaminivorans]